MAYLDISGGFAAPTFTGTTGTRSGSLSPLEWTVVMLAQSDTFRSLKTPSRLSRAFGSVFGLATRSNLADPRLEALRRLAVHAWRRPAAVPAAEAARFLDAGFEPAQLTTILDSIAARKARA